GLAAGHGAALDLDIGDDEAEPGAGGQGARLELRRPGVEAAGAVKLEDAAGDRGERRRQHQPAPAAQPGEAARAPDDRLPGGAPPALGATDQGSHAAFSTIQTTSDGKSIPAWRAISGTSEVGVMPGCVLTSSSTMRPGSPAVSS